MSVAANFDLRGRVGILGGSFDPLHLGHVAAARACLQACRLDLVAFVPTRHNPLKASPPVAGDEERLELLRAGLAGEPKFVVWDLELHSERAGPSYTIDTLRSIRAIAKDVELFLLLGSDLLSDLPRWKQWRDISRLAVIIPFQRNGGSLLSLGQDAPELGSEMIGELQARLVQVEALDISSTSLRESLARGVVPSEQLPAGVVRYLAKRNPYLRAG